MSLGHTTYVSQFFFRPFVTLASLNVPSGCSVPKVPSLSEREDVQVRLPGRVRRGGQHEAQQQVRRGHRQVGGGKPGQEREEGVNELGNRVLEKKKKKRREFEK